MVSNILTLTVPVFTTYTTSLIVTEDSAMLVARMIFLTPGGGLGEREGEGGRGRERERERERGRERVRVRVRVRGRVHVSTLTYVLNTACWSLEDSME